RIGPWRIHHPGQSEEGEVRLECVLLQRWHLPMEFTNREADHAERPGGHLLVPELVLASVEFGQRPPFSVHEMVRTACENPLRCALYVEDRGQPLEAPWPFRFLQGEDRAKVRFGQLRVEGRHLLPLGGEGDLRDARPFGPDGLGVRAGTPRRHEERTFRRIAFHDPSSSLPSEHRVVAEDSACEERLRSGIRRRICYLAI